MLQAGRVRVRVLEVLNVITGLWKQTVPVSVFLSNTIKSCGFSNVLSFVYVDSRVSLDLIGRLKDKFRKS